MDTAIDNMKPFLKWAGGKSRLLFDIEENIPEFDTYYEPFIGGGAVFLHMHPYKAVINDINPMLINAWRQIRDNVSKVIERLDDYDSRKCDEILYAGMRDAFNDKIEFEEYDAEACALMIWINKHCFNGLYRVNRHGFFNVPWNRKDNIKSYDKPNLECISRYLNESEICIRNVDFEEACCTVDMEDFVYFDSPYIPASKTSDFTQYAKDGFGIDDHRRLAALYKKLDGKNVKCLLSNNDVPMIEELYGEYCIARLDAPRVINCKGNARRGHEVLVMNYRVEEIGGLEA